MTDPLMIGLLGVCIGAAIGFAIGAETGQMMALRRFRLDQITEMRKE